MSEQPKPTVGRVVLFKSSSQAHRGQAYRHQAVAAVVVAVWSDTCVNLRVLADGTDTPWVTSVPFVEDIDAYDPSPSIGDGSYACAWGWMPYQKAVHAGQVEPTKHAT